MRACAVASFEKAHLANVPHPVPCSWHGDLESVFGKCFGDFLTWSAPADLHCADSPPEQLYTSQVKPYHRAPHLLIGFPARYIERGWSDSMRALPEREHREWRARASERYGVALTEGLLMASRDGVNFKR
jgi:hypothetical protein